MIGRISGTQIEAVLKEMRIESEKTKQRLRPPPVSYLPEHTFSVDDFPPWETGNT